jgi:uncharacterized protein (TIGR02246 family)
MQSIHARSVMFLCVLVALTAAACDRQPDEDALLPQDTAELPATDAGVPADLEAASNDYIAAWNGSDPSAAAAFFHEDATATVGDETHNGRAGILEGWLAPNVQAVTNLQLHDESWRQVGDEYHGTGRYTLTATPPEGETIAQSGRADVTWTRDAAGQWRIRSTNVQPDPEQ